MTAALRDDRVIRSRYPASGAWWLVASAVVIAFVALPLCGLVYFAARGSGDVWPNLLANVLPDAIRTTVLLLSGVGVLTAAIGVGAAWLVTMFRFPGKRIFDWALLLPLSVPTYIIAYAYLDVMHPIGPVQTTLREILGISRPRDLWFPEIRSLHGCIFLLGVVLYPYVYLPVRALFLMQSAATLEVARTLGANRLRVFLRVAVPLARPAIAVGVSLALMEALNDIGASEFLGIRTLTVAIYTTWVVRLSVEGAAQIALVMLAVVFGLVLFERWARQRQLYSGPTRRHHVAVPQPLTGAAAIAASFLCFLPVFFGFLVPASYLVVASWRRVEVAGLPKALAGLDRAQRDACRNRDRRRDPGRAGARLRRPRVEKPGGAAHGAACVDWLRRAGDSARRRASRAARLFRQRCRRLHALRFRRLDRPPPDRLRRRADPRLRASLPGDLCRRHRSGPRQGQPASRHGGALARLAAGEDSCRHPSAPDRAGDRRRGDACLRRRDEGTAGDASAQPFDFTTLATALYGEAKRGTYEDGAIAALAIVLVGLIPVIVLARVNAGMAVRRRRIPSEARAADVGGHI